MAGDYHRGYFEDSLTTTVEPIEIRCQRVIVRGSLIPPQVGQSHHIVAIIDNRGDVLGGVPRRLPKGNGIRYLKPLSGTGSPGVILIDGPVIVDTGVGKQGNVDGVVGVMMGNDHICDVLDLVAESGDGIKDDRSCLHHSRVDHDESSLGFDQ